MKLSFGLNCKDASAALRRIAAEELVTRIRDGVDGLATQTEQLRRVRRMSAERYRAMKTGLPFFGCSQFHPPYRRMEHFLRAEGWILDLDFAEGHGPWRERLYADPRVMIGYVSPGGDGLKLVFRFDAPATDRHQYTEAYKHFANHFGAEYGILTSVDMRNSDVSRISFLCYDPEVYWNAGAVAITPADFVPPPLDLPVDETDDAEQADRVKVPIPAQTYHAILEKLNTRPRRTAPPVYVPERVRDAMTVIRAQFALHDLEIYETVDIQYGLKIRFRHATDTGEINLYYGRQGFRVVISPRKGTHDGLNQLGSRLAEIALFDSQYPIYRYGQ